MPDIRLTAPTLRKHCRGNWYVRLTPALGGGSKWFGSDEPAARQRYKAWADRLGLTLPEAKTSKTQESECVAGLPSKVLAEMPRIGSNPKTIQQVADSLYKSVDAKSGSQGVAAKRKVRACLVRPLVAWGSKLASDLTADDLIDFQSKTAAELAPNSANDVLTYTRRLLAHAWLIDAVAEPFKTPLLANVARPALTDKTTSLDNLKKLLRMIAGENPNLARALLVQFYMVGRPSELPTLVHATEEKWESENVCAIHGKTTIKTGEPRRLLLTDVALSVLAKIERTFGKRKRLTNGYSYPRLRLSGRDDDCLSFLRQNVSLIDGIRRSTS